MPRDGRRIPNPHPLRRGQTPRASRLQALLDPAPARPPRRAARPPSLARLVRAGAASARFGPRPLRPILGVPSSCRAPRAPRGQARRARAGPAPARPPRRTARTPRVDGVIGWSRICGVASGGSRADPVDGNFAPGISRWRQIRGLGALYVNVTALPNFRLARNPGRTR